MLKIVTILDTASGIPIFSHVFQNYCLNLDMNMDVNLIGCFVGALKQFSTEFNQEEIKLIEMSHLKILFSEYNNLLGYFIIEDNHEFILDIDNYKKQLKAVLHVFYKQFGMTFNPLPQIFDTALYRKFDTMLHSVLKIEPNAIEDCCLNCPMGKKSTCVFRNVLKLCDESKNFNSFLPP